MYSVSQDYLNTIYSIGKKQRRIRGYIDGVAFTENDVVAESLSFSRQLTSSDVKLGGVYVAQLNITFLNSFAQRINRGSWRNRTIILEIGLLVKENTHTWEDIPVGTFYIDDADHTAAGVECVAYDAMAKFDKAMTLTSTGGKFYGLLTLACHSCGVNLGMTQQEVEALPNGLETFSLYPDNDVETWRDFVSWIAVTAGGYATINRYNALEIRTWKDTADITIGINDRFTGGRYSDFITNYTGLYYTDLMTKESRYVENYYTGGLTMNIGADPFLQYGLKPYIDTLAKRILTALRAFQYTPFKASSFIDPFLDLGDVIEFTDGLAGTSSLCCVMKMDYSFRRGVTLEGFGKDPALADARSRTDKNIAGIVGSSENEMVYVKYANAEPIYAACDIMGIHHPVVNKVLLGNVYLTATKDTNVQIHTRVIMSQISESHFSDGQAHDLPNNYRLALIYEFDGDQIARIPFSEDDVYTSKDANARPQTIEDCHTYIGLTAGNRVTLAVYLELTQAEGTVDWCPAINIGQEGIQIVVVGQGLSKEEEWDGVIRCTDNVDTFEIGGITVCPVVERSVIARLVDVTKKTITENISTFEVNTLKKSAISESLNIYLRYEDVYLLSSDGDNIVTDDGDKLLL